MRPRKVGHVVLNVRVLAQAEAFYPEALGFEVVTRFSAAQTIFGPPKTPAAIIARLSQETNVALRDAELRRHFDKLLLRPQGSSPEQLAAVVAKDVETWRVFIRENDIPVE